MEEKSQIFNQITVQVPWEKIYHRLGYQNGTTKVTPEEKKEIDRQINEALALIDLKGVALAVRVEVNVLHVILPTAVSFSSKLLCSLLKGCRYMLCMGVTGGKRIIEAINDLKNSDLKLAVIYDAVASEVVDAGFDWIQNYYAQNLQRQNRRLTIRRISCGYGDFSIKYQQIFYDLLHLEGLGVSINKAYMLIPEKSATAVTGIEEFR